MADRSRKIPNIPEASPFACPGTRRGEGRGVSEKKKQKNKSEEEIADLLDEESEPGVARPASGGCSLPTNAVCTLDAHSLLGS
jgi:hypothetical protein